MPWSTLALADGKSDVQSLHMAISSPVTLETSAGPMLIGKDAVWLHAVDDGGSDVVLSQQRTGTDPDAEVARVLLTELLTGSPTISWLAVGVQNELDLGVYDYTRALGGPSAGRYDAFADQWHIYAHDLHFMSIGLKDSTYLPDHNTGVMLVVFTLAHVAGVSAFVDRVYYKVKSPDDATADYRPFPTYTDPVDKTGDLHMVEDGGLLDEEGVSHDGVAVGVHHTYPERTELGHTVVRVTTEGKVVEQITFVDPSSPTPRAFSNGASARRNDDGTFMVLTPETIATVCRRAGRPATSCC